MVHIGRYGHQRGRDLSQGTVALWYLGDELCRQDNGPEAYGICQ